jgi:hypothetical protein
MPTEEVRPGDLESLGTALPDTFSGYAACMAGYEVLGAVVL